MQQDAKLASAHIAELPPSASGSAVTYIIQHESAPSAKHDWQELWGPPLLTLAGALIGVTVPLLFKWFADRRERRLALMRDLYLKVVAGITEAGTALGMLTAIDAPLKETMKIFADAAGAVGRAELVAPMPVVKSLAKLEATTHELLAPLLAKRTVMELAQVRININEALVKKTQEQIDSTLAEQVQLNIRGVTENGQFDRLTQHFGFLQEQQSAINTALEEDYKSRQQAIEELAAMALEVRGRLVPLQAEAISLLRGEIEFESGFDKAGYLAAKLESLEAAKRFFRTVTDEVHRAAGMDDPK